MNERSLTETEVEAIATIGDGLCPECRRHLISDLANSTIRPIDSDGLRWLFDIPNYERPGGTSEFVPVVGTVCGGDGSLIRVWLEVDSNERILALAFHRTRPGSTIHPDWLSLRVHDLRNPRQRRKPTDGELEAIRRSADLLPANRAQQMLTDAAAASVEPLSLDESLLLFHLDGYERTDTTVTRPVRSTALVDDADGATIRVLVYVDSRGRLAELELIRESPGEVIGPNWATLRLEDAPQQPGAE